MKARLPVFFLALFTFAMFMQTCEKREFLELAAVTIDEAKDITAWEAKVSGQIIDVGQGITGHGHCWSTSKQPTVENSVTKLGAISGKNSFTSTLTNLEPGKTYYVRAYAVSGDNIFYSEEQTFTSRDGVATLQTSAIYDITINTATGGGNIIDNGGDSIAVRGICWRKTSDHPPINRTVS